MRFGLIATMLALFIIVPAVPVVAQNAVPIEEYGKLPDVEMVAISESGNRFAFITTIRGQRMLLAVEGQDTVLTRAAVGDAKVRRLDWIGDDRVLLITSQTQNLGPNFTTNKAEFFIARVLSMSDGVKSGLIFNEQRDLVDSIRGDYGVRQIDGKWFGYFGAIKLSRRAGGQLVFNHGRPYLYRVDLQDFSARRIANAANAGSDNEWLIDANGEIAVYFDVNDQSGRWTLRNSERKKIAEGVNPTGRVGPVGLGKDGTSVIMSELRNNESNWFEIPLAGGEPTPFLNEAGFQRLFFDDATGHLAGYLTPGDSPRPVFFDKDREAAAEKVRKAFGALESRMVDWTSDLQNVLVRTSGNSDSGTIYTVDVRALRAHPLAYERLQIQPGDVGRISVFDYVAQDGMKMDGVLTLPPGKTAEQAKDMPAILFPHGGPHSHDTVSFDWWAQAFASRGYVVFQPNFRGSTNRGDAFRRAGYGEWGRKMQTDKSDGLAALVEAGIVDPERVCIVGASYGGYAALAGVTIQQDIYRCAVAVAPVSDIKDWYQQGYQATGRDRTTKTALLEQLGDRNTWDAVSPRRLAERASAPIMLIHGKDDIVVTYSHSVKMADKLKDFGKPHEMVTLDGEDHWLSLSETRQLMLSSAIRFVEQHNPPGDTGAGD